MKVLARFAPWDIYGFKGISTFYSLGIFGFEGILNIQSLCAKMS